MTSPDPTTGLNSSEIDDITGMITSYLDAKGYDVTVTAEKNGRVLNLRVGVDEWLDTPEWQERLRQSEEDMAAEHGAHYYSTEEFMAHLAAAADRADKQQNQ